MKNRIVSVLAIAFVAFIAWQLTLVPKNDRIWSAELARTAHAVTGADGVVQFSNVRDFSYVDGTTTESWTEASINPESITRAWFIFEPFPSLPVAGHTYLTFELNDGRAYSFSVEARKEADESYSAFAGLFRTYELAYTWGTERDYLTRRLLLLQHPVHMHPLQISAEDAKTLFRSLVEETNELSNKPQFYNTLTANCTNLLAEMANRSTPSSVPYDISWNLPGYSERFLARIGIISSDTYDLTPYREAIRAFATDDAISFSRNLRELPVMKGR